MYDAREKARRDYEWALDDSFRQGEAKGEAKGLVRLIHSHQRLLGVPLRTEAELRPLAVPALEAMAADLQEQLRNRIPG